MSFEKLQQLDLSIYCEGEAGGAQKHVDVWLSKTGAARALISSSSMAASLNALELGL
jgi:hypothetical protein